MHQTEYGVAALSLRLQAVASRVRQGSVLMDVGTDHGLLPVYLVGTGHNPRAVASDIHASPLEAARRAIERAGLQDRITPVLTDGLQGLECNGPTDIVIAGMGGETVVQILSQAPFVKHPDIRLILQPMTKSGELRRYLWENGFCITQDGLCPEDKLYEVFCAAYDGQIRHASAATCLVGEQTMQGRDSLSVQMKQKQIGLLQKRVKGKESAFQNAEEEKQQIAELEEAL